MTDAETLAILKPHLTAAFAAGQKKGYAAALAESQAPARTFAADSHDEPEAERKPLAFYAAGGFTAEDVNRYADYFASDDGGAYPGDLHRHFSLPVRAFADTTRLLRKQVRFSDGKSGWQWVPRVAANAAANAFSEDEQGHEHDAKDGKFTPKGGGGSAGKGDKKGQRNEAPSAAREELASDLDSHEGGQPADYHAAHEDYTADLGFSTPDEITDRFRSHFKEMLSQKDDYAKKAAEYAGAGEDFTTAYQEHRIDLVTAAEEYKDAIGELADAYDQAREIKDELDQLKVSPLDVEDYGRPVKKPDDPAKLPKWEAAMAEFQQAKAAAVADAKAARAAELAELKTKLEEPRTRYRAADKTAKQAHAALSKANDAIVSLIAPLHGPDTLSDYDDAVFSEDFASFADRKDGDVWETSGRHYKRESGVTKRLRNPNAEEKDKAKREKGEAYKKTSGGLTPKEVLVKQKEQVEPKREEARAAWASAVANPNTVGAKEAPKLAEQLHTLTRDEARELLRAAQEKVGGLKAELVQRMLAKLGVPTEEQRRATLEERITEQGLTGDAANAMRRAAGLEEVKTVGQVAGANHEQEKQTSAL